MNSPITAFILIVILGISSIKTVNLDPSVVQDARSMFSRETPTFANFLLARFGEKTGTHDNDDKRAGFIPPDLPAMIPLDPDSYNFSSVLLEGFYEQHDTELHGLNTLSDDLVVDTSQESALILNYTLCLPEIALKGSYSTEVSLNLTYLAEVIPDLPIVIPEEGLIVPVEGTGAYNMSLKEIHANLSLRLNIVNELVGNAVTSLDFAFASVNVIYDNVKFNGEDFPLWDFVNDIIQRAMKELWEAGLQPTFEELLDSIFTDVFKGCRSSDLIDGDYSCTGLVPEPTTPEPDQCSINGSPCRSGMYCEAGQESPYCRCSDQLYAITDYGSERVQCLRVDGASCLLNPSDPAYHPCAPHSACIGQNGTHGRCACDTGYIAAEDGSCAADVGQYCDSRNDEECYEGFMLDCRNRKCECASPSLVYESGRGCVAQLGEPCGIYNKIEREHRIQCASGLQCVQVKVGKHVCEVENEPSTARALISSTRTFFITIFLVISAITRRMN